ncbi:sigma factor-like helix-turn-helix DNA-binding protein [Glycomyces sp. YM15]|uniref:sigma factor-like helix-turn-helix DNA-binding protein n=1 Tax=Glycomyces sp. YM15 TaxID=2800446 RepID=UPI001962AF23|nr:sigma factor-like helix-turn-helix DNA-binding protein [Glycomyces sp. YM15]
MAAHESQAESWLMDAWRGLDERERAVLTLVRQGRTYGAIARIHDVSRARVGQIVKTARASLFEAAMAAKHLWWDGLDELIAGSVSVHDDDLADYFVDPVGTARYSVLLGLKLEHPNTCAGRLDNFWTREPDGLAMRLRSLSDRGPYRMDELAGRAADMGIPAAVPTESLLTHENGPMERIGELLVRRRRRQADLLYLWLVEEGQARSATYIAEEFGREPHALAELMRRDSRFRLRRPESTWELAEWPDDGARTYAGAMDVVLEIVTERGPIAKRELVRETMARYQVTYARVHQCLIDYRIGHISGQRDLIDLVSRGAVPNEEAEPRRPLTAVIDDTGTILGFRLRVQRELLRGCSVAIDRWVTWTLGLRQSPKTRSFTCGELGDRPLKFTRNTSVAQMSTIKDYAESHGMKIGCEITVLLRLREGTAQLMHACATGECPGQRM